MFSIRDKRPLSTDDCKAGGRPQPGRYLLLLLTPLRDAALEEILDENSKMAVI